MGWMTPLDGDAFLTSAMRPGWPVDFHWSLMAPTKSRAGSWFWMAVRTWTRGKAFLLFCEPFVFVPDDLFEDVLGLVRLVVDALALLVNSLHLERELVGADVVLGLAERRAAADGHLRLGLVRDGRHWGHVDGAGPHGASLRGARAAAEGDGRAEGGGGGEGGHVAVQLCGYDTTDPCAPRSARAADPTPRVRRKFRWITCRDLESVSHFLRPKCPYENRSRPIGDRASHERVS